MLTPMTETKAFAPIITSLCTYKNALYFVHAIESIQEQLFSFPIETPFNVMKRNMDIDTVLLLKSTAASFMLNIDNSAQADRFLTGLTVYIKECPQLQLTTAIPLEHADIKKIYEKLALKTDSIFLIQHIVDSTIHAGLTLIYKGKINDLSLDAKISDYFSSFNFNSLGQHAY